MAATPGGFAPWAVLTRGDGQLVGWGGLYEDPFDPGWGVELGYSLHPAAWGQGYATELARACLALADEELEAPEVWAFVHPDNTASRRVLGRAGFAQVRLLPEKDRILLRRARADNPGERAPGSMIASPSHRACARDHQA